jgi:flagellar biogenesis protein FliO
MRILGVLCAVFACVSPALAQTGGNAFVSGQFETSAQDVRFVLEARDALGYPDVSTDPGFIRVRFPRMSGWTHVDMPGDGRAVRVARIRPGASNTGILVVRLGDRREVPASAVSIHIEGTRAQVSISRAVLPALAEPVAPVATAEPAPVAALEEPIAEAAASAQGDAPAEPTVAGTTPAAEVPAAEVPAAEVPAAAAAAAPAGDAPRADASTTGAAAVVPARAAGAAGALGTMGDVSSLPVLALITGLLVLLFGLVKWLQRRSATQTTRGIRVLASQRIGPKQQLVVVRALGQDHFLCVDGGRTERLLSVPSDEEGESAPAFAARRPFLGFMRGGGALPAAKDPSQLKAEPGGAARAGFGAHLLRIAQEEANGGSGARNRERTTSDSVAGIVALRAKAGR